MEATHGAKDPLLEDDWEATWDLNIGKHGRVKLQGPVVEPFTTAEQSARLGFFSPQPWHRFSF